MRYLILLPFIIIPMLVSTQFSDPTLLIRRTSLFIILTLILLVYHFSINSFNKISYSQFKWLFLFLIFILYTLISSYFTALNFNESIWGTIYLIGWLSIALTIILYVNESIISMILITTSLVGGGLSLLALLQTYELIEIQHFSSTSSSFINRNFWGMYLCFIIPATIYSSLTAKLNKNQIIHLLMFTFSICSLIHSRSRAAWLGVFVSLLLLLLLHSNYIFLQFKKYYQRKYPYIVSALILGIIFIFIYTEPIVDNAPEYKKSIWSTLTSTDKNEFKNTLGERIPLYSSTVNMTKDHIILGVGYNNWRVQHPAYYGNYIHDENYLKLNQRPHNDLLWIISEGGIVGLLLFMSVVILPLIFTLKHIIYKSNNTNLLINSVLLVSIISILVESLFDFPKQRTIPNLYMWTFLGYLSIQIPSKKILSNYHLKLIRLILLSISVSVSIFAYRDFKSNQFSKQMLVMKSQKEYDLGIINGKNALNYGKNVDNTGTPITFYLGVLEYQKGNTINSEKYFSKALDIHPYHLGTLENYMIIKAKSNQFEKALEIMTYLRSMYPKYYSPVIKMIKLYLQQNKIDEANLLIEVTNFNDATQSIKKMVDNLKNYIILQSR